MSNINLNDTTTLQTLFDMVDSWSNLPVSSLSPEQISLIQFKNAVFNKPEISKSGGGSVCCFICWTGA